MFVSYASLPLSITMIFSQQIPINFQDSELYEAVQAFGKHFASLVRKRPSSAENLLFLIPQESARRYSGETALHVGPAAGMAKPLTKKSREHHFRIVASCLIGVLERTGFLRIPPLRNGSISFAATKPWRKHSAAAKVFLDHQRTPSEIQAL